LVCRMRSQLAGVVSHRDISNEVAAENKCWSHSCFRKGEDRFSRAGRASNFSR
jgi:hypothetical protein